MPLAKHKITGLVVELSCEQLKTPVYAEIFDEVESGVLCTDCTLPEPVEEIELIEEKPTKANKEGSK